MKSSFKLHTVESAPENSQAELENSIKASGFLPNLHAVMAESPSLLQGYKLLHKLFTESSFNAEELTVVWQTINVEHNCGYCVPAHTAIANMMKVDPSLTEALRSRGTMPTEKLQVLHNTTLSMVRGRGHLTDDEVNAFLQVGYTQRQLLEIVLGIAQKTMSNYTNHLAGTPVDKAFQPFI